MVPPESGTIAVLAEKPSVARDIARVLGATSKGDGYLHGNGYVVAWAIGHLVALAQPHEMNPEWRHWRRDLLPKTAPTLRRNVDHRHGIADWLFAVPRA